jgi:hypothetical protein
LHPNDAFAESAFATALKLRREQQDANRAQAGGGWIGADWCSPPGVVYFGAHLTMCTAGAASLNT